MGPALTSLLAYYLLGEQFTKLDFTSVTSCLLGVFLVARPEFIFGTGLEETNPSASSNIQRYPLPVWIPTIAAIIGAITSAFAYILVRKLGPRVHYMSHVLYFGLMSTIASATILLITKQWIWDFGIDAVKVLGVGILAFCAQGCLNKGLQMANAGPATLMRNLDVFFAFVFGVLLFDEIPVWTSIVGSILIAGTTSIVAYLKYKQKY